MQFIYFEELVIRVDRHCFGYCRIEIKMKRLTIIRKKVVVKSGIIEGGFVCSRKSNENGGSKIKLIMRGNRSRIMQLVIASREQGRERLERFSFSVIAGANFMGYLT